MGMFDTVHLICPKGHKYKLQTKTGPCQLLSIKQDTVPLDIAGSLDGHEIHCEECNEDYEIICDSKSVSLKLRICDSEASEDDGFWEP